MHDLRNDSAFSSFDRTATFDSVTDGQTDTGPWQSMEVDTDVEDGQPVHHEFLEISNELRQLCTSNNDSTVEPAAPKDIRSSGSVISGFPRHGKIYSTTRKENYTENCSTGSSWVARKPLKSRSS